MIQGLSPMDAIVVSDVWRVQVPRTVSFAGAESSSHMHTQFNKSLIVKVVMGSCSLESVLSMLV